MDVLWFIPGHGDTRYLGTQTSRRTTTEDYLKSIALAVDSLGFTGALLPTGAGCEDSWLLASMLSSFVHRMKFLIAVRPGSMSVTLAARMAATFDRLSSGRLMLNIITGGDPKELAGDGMFLTHDGRYEITDEFLEVWKRLYSMDVVDYHGQHVHVEGAQLLLPSVQRPYPPLYFGGSSPKALEVAARHVDVYLSLAEPPDQMRVKFDQVREAAARVGRTVRFGVRAHVFVRERDEDAWDAAENVLRYVDDNVLAAKQKHLAGFDSVGQARMRALHGGGRATLTISPNLWSGIGLVNKGVGTALVGDADAVAERIQEYADIGADTFILSSYPHLEEAYQVAELLFPRLPAWHDGAREVSQVFNEARLPRTWQ